MNLLIHSSRASYYIGGTEVVSLHQAVGLARRGHHITYLVRKTEQDSPYYHDFKETVASENLPLQIGEVALHDTPYGNGHSWPIWHQESQAFSHAAQDQIHEAVRAGVDLTVAHLSTDSLAMPSSTPHLLHLHGSPLATDLLMDKSMEIPQHAIAHSSSIHDWWSSRYPTIPMEIFRNGVPVDEFYQPVDAPRPIDILYVGRFLEHKGITDILDAATPDQSLVIAGRGEFRSEIERKIRDRGLCAEIIDNPSNEELVSLYKSAKIFACPSRSKEGVLTTMLEASAAGCAIVTATGSGMTDLAVDMQNSRLITPQDVNSLQKIFDELLVDDAERMKLAKSMQETVRREWSWEHKAEQLEGIYARARNRS